MDKFRHQIPLLCIATRLRLYTLSILSDCPRYTATACVFLIRVICSCREMCAIKASSVARGVNIPYVDATVAFAGGWVAAARPSVPPG